MCITVRRAKSWLPLLVVLPLAAQDTGLTLDQIVQKHVQALGGMDHLNAIQTVSMTGSASLAGGQMGAPVTIRIKRPAFARMDMHMQERTFVQSFDGTTGWIINSFSGSGAPQKLSDEDARGALDNADFIEGSLVGYKGKGSSVELVGQDAVDGKPAYRLKVTKKSGSVEYIYLDTMSFLVLKTTGQRRQMGQDIQFESMPGNYKSVDGVMIPFSVRQKINGKDAMELSITQVDINVPMDDSIFRMPEKQPDPRAPR